MPFSRRKLTAMNLDELKRLLEEKKEPVNVSINNANAYIEAHSSSGVLVHNPEHLKKRLEESSIALLNAINTDLPWSFDTEESYWEAPRILKQVECLLKEAQEAYWQLRYEIGEIPDFSPIVQKGLDNQGTPRKWNEQDHYQFGDKVLQNGRIQMCVKGHDRDEKFLDNPRYWRDIVSYLRPAYKDENKEVEIYMPKMKQNMERKVLHESGNEWYFEVNLGIFKAGRKWKA